MPLTGLIMLWAEHLNLMIKTYPSIENADSIQHEPNQTDTSE